MKVNLFDEVKLLDISICNRLFEINKDNILSKYPSPLQVAITRYLYENKDNNIYQKDLQEKFCISKSAISDVIDSMEKKGVILRIQSSIDARRNRIILTELGINCFSDIMNNNNNLNDIVVNSLSDDEIECFINVINKIKANLEKEG